MCSATADALEALSQRFSPVGKKEFNTRSTPAMLITVSPKYTRDVMGTIQNEQVLGLMPTSTVLATMSESDCQLSLGGVYHSSRFLLKIIHKQLIPGQQAPLKQQPYERDA